MNLTAASLQNLDQVELLAQFYKELPLTSKPLSKEAFGEISEGSLVATIERAAALLQEQQPIVEVAQTIAVGFCYVSSARLALDWVHLCASHSQAPAQKNSEDKGILSLRQATGHLLMSLEADWEGIAALFCQSLRTACSGSARLALLQSQALLRASQQLASSIIDFGLHVEGGEQGLVDHGFEAAELSRVFFTLQRVAGSIFNGALAGGKLSQSLSEELGLSSR